MRNMYFVYLFKKYYKGKLIVEQYYKVDILNKPD